MPEAPLVDVGSKSWSLEVWPGVHDGLRCPKGHFNVNFSVSHLFDCTRCETNEITLSSSHLSSSDDCICDTGRLGRRTIIHAVLSRCYCDAQVM